MQRLSTSLPIWDDRRLRLAADAAGVALWSWNVDTDAIDLDERAHRLWGLPVDGGFVTFEALSSHIHPQDMDRVRSAFAATREILGAYEIDFRILRDGKVNWLSARGRGEDEGIVGRVMFGVFIDVTERKMAEEAREMLTSEMSHRVKNLFAIASALATIASRSAATPAEMARDMTQRLSALASAHDLIRPAHRQSMKAAPIRALLGALLAAYDDRGIIGRRIHASGANVLVGEASITTLALVVHELATNSVKYGALSAAGGTLDVTCREEDGEVVIVWTERGGPAVAVPNGQPGFGSTLVNRSITEQLGGSIVFDWPRQGLVVTLRMSKARLGV
jgi:two-component sensor histidine kinase